MSKPELIRALRVAATEAGFPKETLLEGGAVADLILKTPCFAAFFVAVSDASELRRVFDESQSRISESIADSSHVWPRDLELVFLLSDQSVTSKTLAFAQQVLEDHAVCRKFVLRVNGKPLSSDLATLPFWPPESGTWEKLPASLLNLTQGMEQLPENLVQDLIRARPGIDKIVENLLGDAYKHTGASKKRPEVRFREKAEKRGLKGISIHNFRGIRQLPGDVLNLNANVVVIYGPNGTGKTSIADAFEWAVTGEVHHLECLQSHSLSEEYDPVVNVFATDDTTEVKCELTNGHYLIRRKRGNSVERLIWPGTASDNRDMIDHAVGTKAPSSEAQARIEKLRDLFRGSHILSQSNMRDFLTRADPKARFDVLTSMIGAEDFVRFRQKTCAVAEKVRTKHAQTRSLREELRLKLESFRSDVQARQTELDKLRALVTSGASAEDSISSLLRRMKACGVTAESRAVKQAGSLPLGRRCDAIRIQAEPQLAAARSQTQQLLRLLVEAQRQLPAYTDSHETAKSLKEDLASATVELGRLKPNLARCETDVARLRAGIVQATEGMAEAVRQRDASVSLLEKLRDWTAARQRQQASEDAIKVATSHLADAKTKEEAAQRTLRTEELALEKEQSEQSRVAGQLEALLRIAQKLPDMKRLQGEMRDSARTAEVCAKEIEDARRALVQRQAAAQEESQVVAKLQREYHRISQTHDSRASLIAQIAQLLDSPQCPLCGHAHGSVQDLRERVDEQLKRTPNALVQMASRLEQEEQRLRASNAACQQFQTEIEKGEKSLNVVRERATVIHGQVSAFLAECGSAGLSGQDDESLPSDSVVREAVARLKGSLSKLKPDQRRAQIELLRKEMATTQRLAREHSQNLKGAEQERRLAATSLKRMADEFSERHLSPDNPESCQELELGAEKARSTVAELEQKVSQLSAKAQEAEACVGSAQADLRKAERRLASLQEQEQSLAKRRQEFEDMCAELHVELKRLPGSMTRKEEDARKRLQELDDLDNLRESLRQFARMDELADQLKTMGKDEQTLVVSHQKAGEREKAVEGWCKKLGALERTVGANQEAAVGEYLRKLNPAVQCIYKRLSPHAIFGDIEVVVDANHQRLDVRAVHQNPDANGKQIQVEPTLFFSDAQLNVLAISVFLAGALSQQWSGLTALIIDDPIQQMDDFNAYAFLDLVRGLAHERQFVIFTCNVDFYALAVEKLRCMNEVQKTSFIAYRLEGAEPATLQVHCDVKATSEVDVRAKASAE